MPERHTNNGWGWRIVAVLVTSGILMAAMFPPCMNVVIEKSCQSATAANCRQIATALYLYAGDHDGKYPDADASMPTTANQAFRVLICEGVLEDERIFGAMVSNFLPDNNIGEAPNRSEALVAGENHWAMTKGATDKAVPRFPLVFENPASATWPPVWNVDAARKKMRGRAWTGGKIIVGFSDQSAELISLQSSRGTRVPPTRDAEGKDIFTRAAVKMEILDIEDRPKP